MSLKGLVSSLGKSFLDGKMNSLEIKNEVFSTENAEFYGDISTVIGKGGSESTTIVNAGVDLVLSSGLTTPSDLTLVSTSGISNDALSDIISTTQTAIRDRALIFQTYQKPLGVTLVDSDQSLTVSQIFAGSMRITPTAARNLTTETAALLISGLTINGIPPVVGDCIDIIISNNAAATHSITILLGAGCTVFSSATNLTIAANSSASFRLQVTNVGTPAYTITRM